jgi:hypothetical protein
VPEERYFVDSNNVERSNVSQQATCGTVHHEETSNMKPAETVAINTETLCDKELKDEKSKTVDTALALCTVKAVETTFVPTNPGDNTLGLRNCASYRLKDGNTNTSVIEQSENAQKSVTVVDEAIANNGQNSANLNNREKGGEENENSRPNWLKEQAVEAVSGKISKTPKPVLKNQTVEVKIQV